MKIQRLALVIVCGLTLNTMSQAGIIVKGSDGSVEKLQSALLGLQTKATLLGFAKNEYDLGMAYYEGKIVQRDPQKAAEWLTKASKKNYAPAMFTLGGMLLTGDGVKTNIQLGIQLINTAAAKGDQQALAFIEEGRRIESSEQATNQVSQNQNTNNGMCSYQDFYIQSAGDLEYAKKNGKVVEDTEEYLKGPCKINITYGQNNIVEIYANFRVDNKNYDAYVATKLKDSCDDEKCGISMTGKKPINKYELLEYDRIVQFDHKGNELEQSLEEDSKFLNEKVKQNQSYCFKTTWAHSGNIFCMNLGGSTVYQYERAVTN